MGVGVSCFLVSGCWKFPRRVAAARNLEGCWWNCRMEVLCEYPSKLFRKGPMEIFYFCLGRGSLLRRATHLRAGIDYEQVLVSRLTARVGR